MIVPVYWWSNRDDVHPEEQWDTGLLRRIFAGWVWPTADVEFTAQHAGRIERPAPPGIVVIGGRHHVRDVAELNADLAHLPAVLLVIVGDEEGVFPWRDVEHPKIRFWVQMPRPGVHDDMADWAFFFGNGTDFMVPDQIADVHEPELDWVFMGQDTHPRRRQAVDGLRKSLRRTNGRLTTTQGFAQGLPRREYLAALERAKVAPCPSGPFTPDTFRVYEALEAGAFPIVDARPSNGRPGYWEMAYGSVPFPIVDDWETVGGHIESALDVWPAPNVHASAWWSEQKALMVTRLMGDLEALNIIPSTLPDEAVDDITILVTTSPTRRDDYVDMIEQTIASARFWLPDAPLVIAADGVRPEQEELRQKYLADLREIAHRVHHVWSPAVLHFTNAWLHQALTTRRALGLVTTSMVLAMEHDTPVVIDEPIDWAEAAEVVRAGFLDVLRFHHEAHIHPEHEYLMLDHQTRQLLTLPIRRTRQWSQRPFLASTHYYRRVLGAHFSQSSRTMVEDKMHSVCISETYAKHRLAIYHPEGDNNIKRSLHLDGRGDDPKYDMRF